MKTAQVTVYGQAPQYVSIPDLPAPDTEHGELQLKILASGVHQVVRSLATGKHYSSGPLPYFPGIDGVGETKDGKRYYFTNFQTGGSLAEYINVPARAALPLSSGADPVQTAAMVNPGLSSWMALRERCANLPEGFTVLILGVTSASGSLAVHLARKLGAAKVIGAARNEAAASSLGLDAFITIDSADAKKTDFGSLGDVDVVLDYVYGPLAEHLLASLKSSKPVQYVHIGSLSALEINITGAILRSKDLTIRGSGPGSFDMRVAPARQTPPLLEALVDAPKQKVTVKPLSEVEKVWDEKVEGRLVFVP